MKKGANDVGHSRKDTTFLLTPPPAIRIGLPRFSSKMFNAVFFGGENLARYLDELNPASLEEYEHRLNSLASSFDAKYQPLSPIVVMRFAKKPASALQIPKNYRRLMGGALLVLTLKDSVHLYALGMNGPAIIDAYSVIERFASRFVLKKLDRRKSKSRVVDHMVERTSLDELAKLLRELRIWDDNDVAVVERLTRLRNGIAHKNQLSVSKLLFSGKAISPFDVPRLANRIDTKSLILVALGLILKIMRASLEMAPRIFQPKFSQTRSPSSRSMKHTSRVLSPKK